MTKTEKIRRALLKTPKAKAKVVAERLGVTVQDVYTARYLAKKENKANGYPPVEIKEGVEVGGLTLTKGKDSMYKWVRNDLLKKDNKANGYHDRFLDAVAGAAVTGMEQVKDGDEELKAINLLFPKIKEEVNHPPHYTVGGIEVIDFIEAKQLNFNLGNVVKYLSRAGEKDSDPLQDLQKARWYLNREIARVE